jgi:predicted O-linked N-acetylglucosamine transferase (SPINDLY family)
MSEALTRLLQAAFEHHRAGRLDEAVAGYREVLVAVPDEVNAMQLLGVARKQQGYLDEALSLLRRAAELAPAETAILNNLGNAYREAGLLDEAVAAFEKALQQAPDYADAWNNLGNAWKDKGDWSMARQYYEKALSLDPSHADGNNNLGGCFHRASDLASAMRYYREAIRLKPGSAVARYNLGNVLAEQGDLEAAIAEYKAAIAIIPDYAEAVSALVRQLQATCTWDDYEFWCDRLRVLGASGSGKVFPFAYLAVPANASEQQACARAWADTQYRYHRARQFLRSTPKKGEKIRVGYLSADFHDHATAYLMAEVFERHDRQAFEIFAYSLGPDDNGAMRQRLLAAFPHFREVRGQTPEAIAKLVAADGIDILVDLKGYTRETGSAVLAYRPAPIQVNYLGYPGTMGADFVDYILTDEYVTPKEVAPYYDEKFAFLADSYQCNDRQRRIGVKPTRAEVGLPAQGFVYCCFNHTYKITPEVFGLWCRLLQETEGSVLWLLKSNAVAERNLLAEAAKLGIAPERLVFAPNQPLEKHLGRLRLADVFLDTPIYNAHTTASDALWAGVPVITRAGATFPQRVAGSLLKAVGLDWLITESAEDYVQKALALAHSPRVLADLKRYLEEGRQRFPLFDSEAFTRSLESLYLQMQERHLAGLPPDAISG